MNAETPVVERDSLRMGRRFGGAVCENGSGPEGASTPESPGLTTHHSIRPRSAG